jgi:hypothetical protein
MGRVLRLVGSLVGIAGVAFGLTLTSQSMRAVQKIGGSCASGNTAFQPRVACPKGIGGTFPLGIMGGLVFLGIFLACTTPAGRRLALLAWSALFLLLGWNFLDFAVIHPNGGQGVSAGFLVCAVIFIIMGAVPLVWLAPAAWKILTGQEDDADSGVGTTRARGTFATLGSTQPMTPSPSPTTEWTAFSAAPTAATSATTATTTSTSTSTGVADQLEKLAQLHKRGDLNDSEYEAAKRDALKGG